MYIEGRLRTRKWQDTSGVEKFATEIIVDNFIFLDPRGEEGEENAHLVGEDKLEKIPDHVDDEVPF
ncbi:single-stranded DNA-binding protein [Patescibacteria group bacterium]|nr:single-stranded DNA-binding protein [Patescibacteria group bacterium]MBP7841792.1 single-stranded DNA-binding protein [Patescibacteria group bacterium]